MDNLLIPPYSQEAEDSVIGSLLINNEIFDEISSILSPADFYNRYHQEVFAAITQTIAACMPADIITVSERMEKSSQDNHIALLGEMAKNVPSISNAKSYAKVIRERAILRQAICAAHQISEMAYNHTGKTAADVVTSAEKLIGGVSDMLTIDRKDTHISNALQKTIDILEERAKSGRELLGISTGLQDLDRSTSGLQTGFYLVGARPAMGKTTFALNLVIEACRQGELCVIFSIEMPEEQIVMKMLAAMASIPLDKIQHSDLDDMQWAAVGNAMSEIKDFNLEIIDDSKATPDSVRLDLLRIKREKAGASKNKKIGMVMVDYIQLMSVKGAENRTLEISEISRELNSMKKEFNCPILALSQLNRELERRTNKRPVSSDLRESGQLEQDADVIMFLYRDEVYDEQSPDKGLAEILIRKARLGKVGTVGARFNGEMQRFEPIGTNILRSEENLGTMKGSFGFN